MPSPRFQALDLSMLIFILPQQTLSQLKLGQQVSIVTDTFPNLNFRGRLPQPTHR